MAAFTLGAVTKGYLKKNLIRIPKNVVLVLFFYKIEKTTQFRIGKTQPPPDALHDYI